VVWEGGCERVRARVLVKSKLECEECVEGQVWSVCCVEGRAGGCKAWLLLSGCRSRLVLLARVLEALRERGIRAALGLDALA